LDTPLSLIIAPLAPRGTAWALLLAVALAHPSPLGAQQALPQTAPPTGSRTATTALPSTNPVTEALRERVEIINAGGSVSVDGEPLFASRTLGKLYSENAYTPLWDRARLVSLIEVLKDIEDDGLRPEDYHLKPLQALLQRKPLPPVDQAKLDLLATDAYALALYHLYFGKVDPVSLDANWNFGGRDIREVDAVTFVRDAIARNRLLTSVAAARPQHPLYKAGRESLAAYRNLAALGGWPTIPEGPALKVGTTDPRVPVLRQRLAITGDLAAVAKSMPAPPTVPAAPTLPAPTPELFDTTLEAALKHAQRRHRMDVDGVLGPGTTRALNVPAKQRVDQLRVNLERARQVLHEIKDDGALVVVDIAGFEVRYLVDGQRRWRTRAVVGQPFRETPVFRSTIDNIVVNPTWTVPPGILAKDILPTLRRNDRSILTRKRLSVIDRNGNKLNPANIDFSRYSASNFPFMLRQDAGPDNALGVVKINFPNPHLVYLHDTPSKTLFNETVRAFSSGCIRTERPLELAEMLLADPARWDRAALDAAVAAGDTRTLRLAKKVPVLIIYWTADRDDDGSVVFKPDPYSRDARELAALDAPFRRGKRPAF
jgi:murein L,D-transpeptidase YcbB/YkuD